jgi:transposase
MFRLSSKITEVFLCKERVDFRKGIDGLGVIIQSTLKENPLSGSLFLFVNRRKDKVKCLYWEKNGFCLWQKRLEKSRFFWPAHLSSNAKITLTGQQVMYLLDGFDLRFWKPHPALFFKTIM